jgi:hypothetical protein
VRVKVFRLDKPLILKKLHPSSTMQTIFSNDFNELSINFDSSLKLFRWPYRFLQSVVVRGLSQLNQIIISIRTPSSNNHKPQRQRLQEHYCPHTTDLVVT